MASFGTETEVMVEKANQLEQYACEFDAACARLKQAATTMGADYMSTDNRDFVASLTQFCVELKALSDRLRNGSNVLNEQAGIYNSKQEENSHKAKGLPG